MTLTTWKAWGLAAVLLLTAAAAQAEEDIPWTQLRDTCKRYLDTRVPENEVKAMAKRLRQRAEQRMSDRDEAEDSAMRNIMLDWAADNIENLKRREARTVAQACFYFVTFYDHGFVVPSQIRQQLTPDNVKAILEHLETEMLQGSVR